MANFGLSGITVYDDDKTNFDIMKSIIEVDEQEEAFYLLDVEDVVRKHRGWLEKMPRVFPHFALKCNPDPTVVRTIAALNGRYDCASKQEIQLVMECGVSPDRIIFANPIKGISHVRYAKKVGVDRMTVDTTNEVLKLKKLYPEAKLVIRIGIDGFECGMTFSRKFGCEPTMETVKLMSYIKEVGMCLHGFSFHLGSPCWDADAYGRAIETCNQLIKVAESMGFPDCKLIDIGGGISGIDGTSIEQVAASVNAALENVDPSIEIISEPGRYYVETAFTLAACVQGKKVVEEDGVVKQFYYVNDGTYGAFINELLGLRQQLPSSLYELPSDKKYPSVIWGHTCDPYDCIIKGSEIPNFEIGDWMVWDDMGAYSLSNATVFNGYPSAVVFPVIRRSAFNDLIREVQAIQKSRQNGNDHDNHNGYSR
ncbi:ornithine decarboxylase 2 [Fopius arisanus]|uniref:Ornithine decarboxylase 2 n=3 Tax=Fopius arisanus TaxID=64838 RepID=A0A9R1TSH9_9HYME|nr:PREDICTED: ornithine decarboxylase 2-like [Fopius arisanus]